MNRKTARQIVDCVAEAWEAGQSNEVIIRRLGELGLSDQDAAEAIEMVRNGLARAAVLSAGMTAGQISSNFEDHPVFRAAVKKARAEIGRLPPEEPKSVAELEAGLKDADPDTRSLAAYDLGQTGDLSAVPLLLDVLDDPDASVRISVIQSLRDLGSSQAVPALCKVLDSDSDRLVLTNAIRALVSIRDKSAVPALIEATRHDDPFVRHDAAWALGELRDKRAVPALEALLQDTAKPEAFDENGILSQTSIYRVCDHAHNSLRKLRQWWRFW